MDEIVVAQPAPIDLATVFEERYIDLAFPEDISFDDAVERVKAAKRLKHDVIGDVHASYRAYIAELSTCHAVEQGGVSRFAKLAGLNYANLRQWRSRYLPADKKRKYARTIVTVSQLEPPVAEAEPEVEIVDAVVEEVVESEPVFEDMFDGRERKASGLETEPERTRRGHTVSFSFDVRMPRTRRPVTERLLRELEDATAARHYGVRSIQVTFIDGQHATIHFSK